MSYPTRSGCTYNNVHLRVPLPYLAVPFHSQVGKCCGDKHIWESFSVLLATNNCPHVTSRLTLQVALSPCGSYGEINRWPIGGLNYFSLSFITPSVELKLCLVPPYSKSTWSCVGNSHEQGNVKLSHPWAFHWKVAEWLSIQVMWSYCGHIAFGPLDRLDNCLTHLAIATHKDSHLKLYD